MKRRTKKEKNEYPCRQLELYETAETAWNLFVLHLGDFGKFRGKYSTKFYEDRMQDIERAKNIKARPIMQAELKQLRKELISSKKDVLFHYLCIQQYIESAKPNNRDKIFTIAGTKYSYRKASNNNWQYCLSIKGYLQGVLKSLKYELLKDENMPESFFDNCEATCDNFEKIYSKYDSHKSIMKLGAQEKVRLNNIIYGDLTVLLKNAQFLYRNRPDMQQLFQFDKLLKVARKKKSLIKTKTAVSENKQKGVSFLNRVAAMF